MVRAKNSAIEVTVVSKTDDGRRVLGRRKMKLPIVLRSGDTIEVASSLIPRCYKGAAVVSHVNINGDKIEVVTRSGLLGLPVG